MVNKDFCLVPRCAAWPALSLLLLLVFSTAAWAVQPSQEQAYARLQAAEAKYKAIAAQGGWGLIGSGVPVAQGGRDKRVPLVRKHLALRGDLAAGAVPADPEVLDPNLAIALRVFQGRHGIPVTGTLDAATVSALNVPVESRLRAIGLNLRRLEGMPDLGSRYLLVNIPGKQLTVFEEGRPTFVNRIAIGREDRPTPELRSKITRIELNPYWNVPPNIARLDLVKKARNNPGFFAEWGMRLFSGDGEVSPAKVDWSRKGAGTQYRWRQDPGPMNALGPAKFVFANSENVYLHGTSAPAIFYVAQRAFTSGCIRTENPLTLAAHLLRDTDWTRQKINDAVATGNTRSIDLQRPITIYLAYLTAWVDDLGQLHFAEDLYGRDYGGQGADNG
jgi:murein L,D-transpeptidase YcbB/YkuD